MGKSSSSLLKLPSVRAVFALLYGPYLAATWMRRPAAALALEEAQVRQTGITHKRLKALVRAGYLERAQPAAASNESGPCTASSLFLTVAGVSVAEKLLGLPASLACNSSVDRITRSELPSWNRESRELSFRGQLLRHFKRTAPIEMVLLEAFAKQGWQEQVEIPPSPTGGRFKKDQVRKALENLSRRQKPKLIHFSLSFDGRGMCWEPRNGLS